MLIRRCLVCNKLISNKAVICESCFNKLKNEYFDSYSNRCSKCGYPVLNDLYQCRNCNEKNYRYKIYPISDYNSKFSKDILFDFKFSGNRKICNIEGLIFNDFLEKLSLNKDDCIIVPVPCSKESIRKRGWDQMKLVAKVLHNKYRYKYKCLLQNRSDLKEQKTLDKENRIKNSDSKYIFIGDSESIKNKTIIVIDDVMTTGSTMRSCIDTVYRAGIENVVGITLFAQL